MTIRVNFGSLRSVLSGISLPGLLTCHSIYVVITFSEWLMTTSQLRFDVIIYLYIFLVNTIMVTWQNDDVNLRWSVIGDGFLCR